MKESIAQAFILNLILFFFIILVLLLFGSINYSKAYKVKNRILTIIEKYGGYPDAKTEEDKAKRGTVQAEINDNMVKAGYQTTVDKDSDKCGKFLNDGKLIYPLEDDTSVRHYDYCVIKHDSTVGDYYQVVVYMKFEVPVIGGFLEFPVKGETKALYDNIEG